MKHADILKDVVAELEKRTGDLRQLSCEAGISYDTVLRIKNGEGDPGYSKVRQLALHFGLLKDAPKKRQPAATQQEVGHG